MVHQLIRVIRHPESEITQLRATDDRSHARNAQHSQKLLVEQQLDNFSQSHPQRNTDQRTIRAHDTTLRNMRCAKGQDRESNSRNQGPTRVWQRGLLSVLQMPRASSGLRSTPSSVYCIVSFIRQYFSLDALAPTAILASTTSQPPPRAASCVRPVVSCSWLSNLALWVPYNSDELVYHDSSSNKFPSIHPSIPPASHQALACACASLLVT